MMRKNRRRTSLLRNNCDSRRNGNAKRSRRDMRKHAQELWELIRAVLRQGQSRLRLDKTAEREIETKVEVETTDKRIDDRIASQDLKSCLIHITHRNQASRYKSVMGKLHDQEHLLHVLRSKSYAHLRDQMAQAEEDSDSQIGVGKRVDFSALDYQPPPIFPAISMTFWVSLVFLPTSLTTAR